MAAATALRGCWCCAAGGHCGGCCSQGDIAFAEAFIDGDWDSPDLPALIELAGRNVPTLTRRAGFELAATVAQPHPAPVERQHQAGQPAQHPASLRSRQCVLPHLAGQRHELFVSDFLRAEQTLEDAQTAKQLRVIGLMETQPAQHVLEIGCGWGGLAEQLVRAAACRVTGVTLSPAQLEVAQARSAECRAPICGCRITAMRRAVRPDRFS